MAGKTGYVKATKVQGDSKEVGAKVIYQGREMTVSQGIDKNGDLRMIDLSGVMKLCEAFPQSKISSLKCAATQARNCC